MNKDYGIFKDLVEGNLTVTINDFGGHIYSKSNITFPFQAKIVDFSAEDCEVFNPTNRKSYNIYNTSIDEYNTKTYSDYVWNSLITYFKIKFIIEYPEYQEQANLIEEVEYLMQDIGIG